MSRRVGWGKVGDALVSVVFVSMAMAQHSSKVPRFPGHTSPLSSPHSFRAEASNAAAASIGDADADAAAAAEELAEFMCHVLRSLPLMTRCCCCCCCFAALGGNRHLLWAICEKVGHCAHATTLLEETRFGSGLVIVVDSAERPRARRMKKILTLRIHCISSPKRPVSRPLHISSLKASHGGGPDEDSSPKKREVGPGG